MNDDQIQPKIFCIGLNKTGTLSLHKAFELLRLKSVHWRVEKEVTAKLPAQETDIQIIIRNNYLAGKNLLTGIENFDAYSDWNFYATNHLFTLLDKQCPGSKFILHTRNLEDWLKSRVAHIRRAPDRKEQLKKTPNDPWFGMNIKAWREEYDKHHKNVFDYFRDRPQDLLILNICTGDGWKKLCPFLGVSVPNRPFPHINKKPVFNFISHLLGKTAPVLLKFPIAQKMNAWRKNLKNTTHL